MDNVMYRVCIFCGSRSGKNKSFAIEGNNLGASLAKAGIGVVFGGGSTGIMGSIAKGVTVNNGEILGVIPKFLRDNEKLNQSISSNIVTETMHERKSAMFENSSAFIVMPGGLGTMDEACEILTWSQLGLHKKLIIFLNINNFWTPFFHLLDHLCENNMLSNKIFSNFQIVSTVQDATTLLLDSKRNVS